MLTLPVTAVAAGSGTAPVQYYQVAAPLIVALLAVVFLQVRSLEAVTHAKQEESVLRVAAVVQAVAAISFLALILAGESAALEALRTGGTHRREVLVVNAIQIELGLAGAGLVVGFLDRVAKLARRWWGAVYLGGFALFFAMELLFRAVT